MKKAILYTRVSTDEQADLGFSLAQQKRALYNYCQANSIEVAVHFEDDCSGKDFERPQWKALLRFAKQNKGNIESLLFTKWDRLGRNIQLTFSAINQIRELGIQVNGIEQGLDLNVNESKILLSIYLSMGEVERDIIKSRTKKGMMEAKRQGRWCGTAPLGYKYEMSETIKKTVLKLKYPQAKYVERAFELYSQGMYSIPEVQSRVTKEFDGEIKLSKQAFINLLNNRVYSGFIKVDKIAEDDDDFVLGLHEPIISDALFLKVNGLLKGRRVTKNIRDNEDDRFQLRGFLTCSVCGRNLTGSAVKNKRFAYYQCQFGHRFSATIANKHFEDLLTNTFKLDSVLVNSYKQVLEDTFNDKNDSVKNSIKKMDRRVLELRDNLDAIKNDYINRKIDAETYAELKKDINGKINAFVVDRSTLDENLKNDFGTFINGSLPLLKNLGQYYQTVDVNLKRTMLKVLLEDKISYQNGEYQTLKL
jgi:site-specific DNA recombinase